MKELKTKPAQISDLIDAALLAVGADRIPTVARQAMATDLLAACAALIKRRITSEYVGKMVARGLAQQEGGEGDGGTASPSQIKSRRARSAQSDVDFRATKTLAAHDGKAASADSTGPLTEGIL